jgi:hypothetical protein
MKSLVPLILVSIACGVGASLSARHNPQPEFKTIVVDRFVNTSGTTQSPAFIQSLSDGMRDGLLNSDLARQVVEEGVTVNAADASSSLIVEGRFTGYTRGDLISTDKLAVEISVYRASDHVLVKSLQSTVSFRTIPINTDTRLGSYAGSQSSRSIAQGMKGVSPAAIAPAVQTASK